MEFNSIAQSFWVQEVDELPEYTTDNDITSGPYEGPRQAIGRFHVSDAFLRENPNIDEERLKQIAMKIFDVTSRGYSSTTIAEFITACEGEEKTMCKYSLDGRSAFSQALVYDNFELAQYILDNGANPSQFLFLNEIPLDDESQYITYETPLLKMLDRKYLNPTPSIENFTRSLLDHNAKIFLHKKSEESYKKVFPYSPSFNEIQFQNSIFVAYHQTYGQELQNLFVKYRLFEKHNDLVGDINKLIQTKLVELFFANDGP